MAAVEESFLTARTAGPKEEISMGENTKDVQVVSVEDQAEPKVIADLDGEIELETADTSFTFTEPRLA
jgi:hypothetical protein